MMDWTDRHCRFFHRLLHPNALLYTEMVHANAVVRGDRDRLLSFHPQEHPVAVQLGGSDPSVLARAAEICVDLGYDEVNLNVGCPSERVQSGAFGACLMAQPALVAECVSAMKAVVAVPVTVKTRIGIDDQDSDEFLHDFIQHITNAGVDALTVHARIALLSGLSPKQNREVPPLNYDRVLRMRALFPDIPITLNGGITTLEQIDWAAQNFDGVMIGRAAYHNPWLLTQVAQATGCEAGVPESRRDAIALLLPYLDKQLAKGSRLNSMTRHILGLFAASPGARQWRRHLSQFSHQTSADSSVVREALELVDQQALITYN